MKVYTKEQIDMAINMIKDKMFYLNQGVDENSLEGSIDNVEKQAEVAEITLDALKFFRDNGLGQNIDEYI